MLTLPFPERRDEVQSFVKRHHYSRRCPGVWSVAYGLANQRGQLQAVLIYGPAPYPSVARAFVRDPGYASRAAAFGRRVRDVSEILSESGLTGPLHPVKLRVAYHDACHLAHGQRVRSQPRSLLAAIPGLTLVPLQESDFCCGSAGVYNLLHPKVAREFLNRKLDRLAETGADVVVAGNPGCLLQIAAGLRERAMPMRAAHTIELLDWAYRGVTP